MKSAFKIAATALVLAVAAATVPQTAIAESISPKVAAPSVTVPTPGGNGFAGSWRVQGLLYNRFQLAVHLDEYGGGGYRAKIGNWETCKGSLSWHRTLGNKVVVQLSSSWCDGPSGKWSADKMVCKPQGGYNILVPNPGPSYGHKLSCTYMPGSGYYSTAWISMKRS